MAASGLTLLSACGGKPMTTDVGKLITPGAPFPSAPDSPTGGPSTPGAGGSTGTTTSNGPGDSHTNPTPPPDPASNPGPGGAATNDPPPVVGKPQFYVHEGDKAIALTIDDGPDPRYTPQVLALLAQYKIQATFCMLGSSAKTHPGLVQEVTAAGHLIANHTYTHADLSKKDLATVRSDITRANDALAGAGAHAPTFFRAPYGAWSPTVFQVCQELNLRPLDWSVDPKDWARPGTDSIVNNVMAHTHTGAIILEHDGGGDRSQTVAALTKFLPQLLHAGYRFVQP